MSSEAEADVFRWEDPPTPRVVSRGEKRPLVLHEVMAARLRREPGRWALVYECPYKATLALSHEIKRGAHRAYRPAGHFEAVQRYVGDSTRVYARYVGEVRS